MEDSYTKRYKIALYLICRNHIISRNQIDGIVKIPSDDIDGAQVRKREIDGKDTRIAALAAAGAAQAQAAKAEPIATVGIFADGFEPWEAGKSYAQYDLFPMTGRWAFADKLLQQWHISHLSARAGRPFTVCAPSWMRTVCIRMCITWRQPWA